MTQILLPNTHSPTWPAMFSRTASAVSIILGIAVIIGWTFYYWFPSELLPFIITIKPNSAICFILSGTALWIYTETESRNAQNSIQLYLAEVCSSVVLLMGSLTLFEYFFHINLGIDQLFFLQPMANSYTLFPPGRMSPFTSSIFFLIGFTLLFYNNSIISYRVHQLLISLILFLLCFEFLNHIYKVDSFVEFWGVSGEYSQIAIPSLFTLVFLTLGILFARPQLGVTSILTSERSGGTLARRLLPPAFILPIILGYFGLAGKWSNLSEAEFRISLLVMGTIIFFAIFILIHAYFVDRIEVERKRVEQALKLNQAQLQAILDNTSAVIYIFDLSNRFLLVNKRFEKLFHISANEVIGKKANEVFPQSLAEKTIESNHKVIHSRLPIAVEESITDENGSYFYISNKFPLFTEKGLPYAIAGIATEITEIKRIHETLRESEERLNVALNSAHAGTWSWDVNKDIVIWDQYLYQLFGLKPNTFIGTFEAVVQLIHPDDRPRVSEDIKLAFEEGKDYDSEFRIVHPDGSIRYLASRGTVSRDTMGKPVRMSGICWDITRRKQGEDELRHAKEFAESLAEQAEEASRAKSAFLAAMSHEIRTPLNGVIGMTGLILDTDLSKEQREYTDTIRISGEALLSVINDILDFSKIESGRMELENVDFDLHILVDDCVEIISPQTHRKGLAIGAYIDPDVPRWLTGDPSRIRQILNNLLSNAAKFTEKGEISIKIKLLKKQNNNVTLLFEVIDSGIGITPEISKRLFQPFSQGDLSTSRKYGGTGLGLAISKRLIEIMNGSLNVDSTADKGSRFWFTIDLMECPIPITEGTFEIPPLYRNTRILCVDDNEINRDIMQRQLDMWQMRARCASNAAEAISMLKKAAAENDPYRLVLADYVMPGMSGIEMIKIIRELKDISDTAVIIMSSIGTHIEPDEMKELAISASLSKPIRQDRLFESITSVLKYQHEQLGDFVLTLQPELPLERKKYRILLAEDNTINQQVAVRLLEKMGYRVDIVGNGLEVLDEIQKLPYDLILMDCQMPDMDGYTATEEIRKLEAGQNKHIPIIAMTAHALKGDREKCLSIGMDDYMSKPIDRKTLEATLSRWLVNIPIESATPFSSHETSQEIPTTTDPAILDMNRLYDIFGNDIEILREFMETFVTSTTSLLEEAKNSLNDKNTTTAGHVFHRLKGSAGNSGVMKIHGLCVQVEEMISASDWEGAEQVFHDIEKTFKQLKTEIDSDIFKK